MPADLYNIQICSLANCSLCCPQTNYQEKPLSAVLNEKNTRMLREILHSSSWPLTLMDGCPLLLKSEPHTVQLVEHCDQT